MPDSERSGALRSRPDVATAAKANPKVDAEKVREAQAVLEELRKAGLARQEYEISSPYERRPLRGRRTRED